MFAWSGYRLYCGNRFPAGDWHGGDMGTRHLSMRRQDVIATGGRAIFNDYTSKHDGNTSIMHKGISFYSPNINIFAIRAGDAGRKRTAKIPFLTSQFAISYIHGLQGDDPKYVKALACAKHFAVHSGPELGRKNFNSTPPEDDLYDTYLPAFEAAVRDGQVGSVMGSYNALNGVPNCANPFLLEQILRLRWGFQGFVVSDGGAIANIWRFHQYVPSAEDAAAVAVKGGCDLFSASIANGNYPQRDFRDLGLLLKKDLLSENEIDSALSYTFAARFRLGLFDPPAHSAMVKNRHEPKRYSRTSGTGTQGSGGIYCTVEE